MIEIGGLEPVNRLGKLYQSFRELEENGFGGEGLTAACGRLIEMAEPYVQMFELPHEMEHTYLTNGVAALRDGRIEEAEAHISVGRERHFWICMTGTAETEQYVYNLMQGFVMQAFVNAARGDIRLRLFDPVNAGACFGLLNNIAAADEELFGGKAFSKDMDIGMELDRLLALAEKNVQTVSGFGSSSVYEYNNVAAAPVPVTIAVFYAFDRMEPSQRDKLDRLQKIAETAGVSMIMIPSPEMNSDAGSWCTLTVTDESHVRADYNGRSALLSYVCGEISQELVGELSQEKELDSLAEHQPALADVHFRDAPLKSIEIPIGLTRNSKLEYLQLGSSMSAHLLISGTTGSGKSVLLHTIIDALCMNYHPNDLEIWAIDYKAVEFATYVTSRTPHITVIGQDNSPDFSMSLLERVQEEFERRKRCFVEKNVPSYSAYREAGEALSRIVIVIDEFHNLTQVAKENPRYKDMLENQLKEIRAMGMSYIFCSQAVATGLSGLTDSAQKQIGVRICLKNSSDEVTATIPDMGPEKTMYIKQVLNFGTGQMLYRRPRDDGSYDYLFLKGLFFTPEFREKVIAQVRAEIGDNYTHRREIICKSSQRYDITEKPYHTLNLFVDGGEMPAAEDGIYLYPGAPTDLNDDLPVYLERVSGNNLLVSVADHSMRESVIFFSVMSLLSQKNTCVHVHFVDNGKYSISLKEKLKKLQTDRLIFHEGARSCFDRIYELKNIRASDDNTVDVLFGIQKMTTYAEDLASEIKEAQAAAKTEASAGTGGGSTASGSAAPEAGGSVAPAQENTDYHSMNDDELDAVFQTELAALMARKAALQDDSSQQRVQASAGRDSQTGGENSHTYDPSELQEILNSFFHRGPDRGCFAILIVQTAKQLKQGGITKLEPFEHRIGGVMSADDAYTLYGTESFARKANDNTLAYYAGSSKNGKTIRPYLMPDDEYISRWKERVNNG